VQQIGDHLHGCIHELGDEDERNGEGEHAEFDRSEPRPRRSEKDQPGDEKMGAEMPLASRSEVRPAKGAGDGLTKRPRA
jgi:hypothetical protein